MSSTLVIERMVPRDRIADRMASFIRALPLEKSWQIETREYRRTRSDQQNRYLWGVVYSTLLKSLPGWDAEDVHEYFLGEHFGWETLDGLGKKRLKPLRRSSRLNKTEFADYVGFIQRKAAELGVFIPDPESPL